MYETDLYNALVASAEECQRVVDYYPARFMVMLDENGAVATAIELIMRPTITDGLVRLWKEGRLDLSVEAIVLKGPWKRLFPEPVLSKARKWLKDLGYAANEYVLSKDGYE